MFVVLSQLSSSSLKEYWTKGVTKDGGYYAKTDSTPCTCNTGLTSSAKAISWWMDRINAKQFRPSKDQTIPDRNTSWLFGNVFYNAFLEQKIKAERGLKWFLNKDYANYEQTTFYGGYYKDVPGISNLVETFDTEGIDPPELPKVYSKKIVESLQAGKTVIAVSDKPHHFNIWGVTYDNESQLIVKACITDSSMKLGNPEQLLCYDVITHQFEGNKYPYLYVAMTKSVYGEILSLVTLDSNIEPLLDINKLKGSLVKKVEAYKKVPQNVVGRIPTEQLNKIEEHVNAIKSIDDYQKCLKEFEDTPVELKNGYYRLVSANPENKTDTFFVKYSEEKQRFAFSHGPHDEERLEEIFEISEVEPYSERNIAPIHYTYTGFLYSPNTGKYPGDKDYDANFPPAIDYRWLRTTFGRVEYANFHVARKPVVYDFFQPSTEDDSIVLWDAGNSPYTTSPSTMWLLEEVKGYTMNVTGRNWITKTLPFPVKIPEGITAYYMPKDELMAKKIPAGTVIPTNFSIIFTKAETGKVTFEIATEEPNAEYTVEGNRLSPINYVCNITETMPERFQIVKESEKIVFKRTNQKQESNTAVLFLNDVTKDQVNIPYDVAPPAPVNPDEQQSGESIDSKMSPGIISAIVIGCIVLIALIAGVAFFIIKKKKKDQSQVGDALI